MNEFPYLLFLKMYRNELQNSSTTYIEHLTDLPEDDKKAIQQISMSFIQFLAGQMKHQKVNMDALEYWIKIHHTSLPRNQSSSFTRAIEYVITTVLDEIDHPNKNAILETHNQVMSESMKKFKNWHEQPSDGLELSIDSLIKLNTISKELILLNGTEDLPIILKKSEEIFHYKRAIFYSYNPLLNEFTGMIGYDLPKIHRLHTNIDLDLIFAMKQPVFFKEPTPYIQQAAIDVFNFSSVIFIPVELEQQLFGWISFDQLGQPFDSTDENLALLEDVGKRIGMYLGRKQLRSSLNYRLKMSEKEFAVLYLLAEGYSNKQMAEVLYLSEFTVRDYVQKLMIKLLAKNRTQIVSTAFRMGLVE